MIFKRFNAAVLVFVFSASAVHAEILADTPAPGSTAAPSQPPTGAPATGAPTNPATAISPSGKEPLIEVSVDTLEISDKNEQNLGFDWTQSSPILFKERSIPSIFNIGTFTRTQQLQASLNALITNNQARVLANPTLLTKSSNEATFSVGGEIPYPTVGQGGVQGVEYKKYGVIIKILPIITPRKTIEARIDVTVSNPDNANSITLSGIKVPAIASRDASSKVEVLDGDTVVLAGIKQSTRDKTIIKVPFLGSIPLLGLLFRSTDEVVSQNSLVMFVTFRLIK